MHDPKKCGDSGTVEEWVNHDYIKVRMSNGNLIPLKDKGGPYTESGGQIRAYFVHCTGQVAKGSSGSNGHGVGDGSASKQDDTSEPPAKKVKKGGAGGFKGMECPFTKSEFMRKARELQMDFEMKPKEFGPGGFGWQKAGGVTKVMVDDVVVYVRASCIAHVVGSKTKEFPIDVDTFMKTAKPLKKTFDVVPCEFSTGSFGWMCHCREEVMVDGVSRPVQLNFNIPINTSKAVGNGAEDEVVQEIEASALDSKYLSMLGSATMKERDDLTKIRGVGPWIEARLNKIQIYKFHQIAKMTPEIEDAVNEAIKYFPGRVKRDEWRLQARALAGGKWSQLNPIKGKSGKVNIDGEEYENKLIEIAGIAMSDGHIEHFEAEALWFSASDGNKITKLEEKNFAIHHVFFRVQIRR